MWKVIGCYFQCSGFETTGRVSLRCFPWRAVLSLWCNRIILFLLKAIIWECYITTTARFLAVNQHLNRMKVRSYCQYVWNLLSCSNIKLSTVGCRKYPRFLNWKHARQPSIQACCRSSSSVRTYTLFLRLPFFDIVFCHVYWLVFVLFTFHNFELHYVSLLGHCFISM